MVRLQPTRIFAALTLAAVVGTASCSATSSPATQDAAPDATPTATYPDVANPGAVPVVACATKRGVDETPATVYPTSIAATPDVVQPGDLAYYTDDVRSVAPILGPRGWTCSVEVGADGGTVVNVFPTGTSATSSTRIRVEGEPACQGCVYGLTCGLVPGSGKQLGFTDLPCPVRRPNGESVYFSEGSANPVGPTDDIVTFQDPAGVKGSGNPSGGAVPAGGALLYSWTPDAGGSAALLTCTLPDDQHDLCNAVINDFIGRSWGMS